MIDIEQINKYNEHIRELNEELMYYKNSIFVKNFILFLIGNACNQIEYRGSSENQFKIQEYPKYLTTKTVNNIKKFTKKDSIQNFLNKNEFSIFFRIIHKFYNQEQKQDHYKIEFYYFKNEEYFSFKLTSFITEPEQFNLACFTQFLKTKLYEQKTLYQFDFDSMETLQNNLLIFNKIKTLYLFNTLHETSEKKDIKINKNFLKV